MALKVFTWSNSRQLNPIILPGIIVDAIFTFHVYFSSCTCIRVRILFRYKRCDICVDLHMISDNYMLRMAVLHRIRGWFYYVL